ncbi:MAG TPA: sigma-54-dependent Fis family transcriptional regulator [Planctomycetaceae bacterium]|nr:sigma-54-dependent Fis family transcriptional regulator [Planctomycetaceae bacterium]
MHTILVTWIGKTDLKTQDPEKDPGPVLRFLRQDVGRGVQQVYLLNDIVPANKRVNGGRSPEEFISWLAKHANLPLEKFNRVDAQKNFQSDLQEIWKFTYRELKEIQSRHNDARFLLLLSAGYPAAEAPMIVAAECLFDPKARQLYRTSRERGLEPVTLPFDLSFGRLVARERREGRVAFHSIKGTSGTLQRTKELAAHIARFDKVTVLLLGERGTGKELFAKAIHQASPRADQRFVARNCAAISKELLEAELFGHVKGAFTGAVADSPGAVGAAGGGTLFLDEIGHMPLDHQVKMLRFLEDGTYYRVGESQERCADVRVIAATNVDLGKAIRDGRFLADLYDRISEFPIEIPPLRDRMEDLKILAEFFLDQANDEFGSYMGQYMPKQLTSSAVRALEEYRWHGNVRELRNRIRQLALQPDLCGVEELTGEHVKRLMGPPDMGYGLPLSRMTHTGFINHLAAVIEELLARYEQESFPIPRPRNYNLKDEILGPLLYGRALYFGGTKCTQREASYRIRSTNLTFTRDPIKRHLEQYNEFLNKGLIDEQAIRTIRGVTAPGDQK